MSTDKGYVKIFRDIWDHWVSKEKPFDKFHAWVDLIMMVNHEDSKVPFDSSFELVKRGSTLTSIHKLSFRWGWSPNKVRRFLDALEADHMVTQKRNSRRTIISIVNYSKYQGSRNSKRNSNGTLTEHSRNTDGNKQYTIEDTIKKEEESAPRINLWDEPGGEIIDLEHL